MDTRQQLDEILACPLTLTTCLDPVILTTGQTCEHEALRGAIRVTYQSPREMELEIRGTTSDRNPFCPNEIMFDTSSVLQNRVYSKIIACLHQDSPDIPTLLKCLCCPITKKYFINPVVASDGYTYERDALVDYLARHHNKTPRGVTQTHSLVRQFVKPVVAVDEQVYEHAEIERYLNSHFDRTPTGEKQEAKPYYAANSKELARAKTPQYRNLIILELLCHDHVKTLITQDAAERATARSALANHNRFFSTLLRARDTLAIAAQPLTQIIRR